MDINKKLKGLHIEKLPLRMVLHFSLILNVLIILVGLISRAFIPPEIPILYGFPQGESQIANSFFIILPASIALLLTLLNSIIALKSDGIFIKKSLILSTFAISLLAAVTTIKIIFLIGSF